MYIKVLIWLHVYFTYIPSRYLMYDNLIRINCFANYKLQNMYICILDEINFDVYKKSTLSVPIQVYY